MYKEWRGERMEMSDKCQMPAGSVQFISPAEIFTPGKRDLARVGHGGLGSQLLMTLDKTSTNVIRMD